MTKETIDKYAKQDEWSSWVGKMLTKHSPKPFKSGKKEGIAIEYTINPYSGKPAFKMDDDSIVDCHQVKLVEN